MNINLGVPYEAKLRKIIEKGYAGNQTEVIRQAINAYDRQLEEEEARLVQKGVDAAMRDIRSGKSKTYTYEQVKKELGL